MEIDDKTLALMRRMDDGPMRTSQQLRTSFRRLCEMHAEGLAVYQNARGRCLPQHQKYLWHLTDEGRAELRRRQPT